MIIDQSNIFYLSLWILATIIQLFYYLFFYIRVRPYKEIQTTTTFNPPVSVIICARNEEENLKQFLPYILNQKYPDYEVIVVNDASEDDSELVLKEFSIKYSHLKISTIKKDEKFTHGKKLALTIGIKAAKNDILVFTDADCYPVSESWLKEMVQPYSNHNIEIVLGYGGYICSKSFLNKIIRFDALFIAMQYLSFAKAGIAYMGVGRNLSYRKSLFIKNKGFAHHSGLLSGDDDLFVNETATKSNVAVVTHVHTRSIPRKTFKSWILQKKRHQSTFSHYKNKHKLLIILEPLSRWLFYGFIPILLLNNILLWPIIISIFTVRLVIQILTFYFSTKTLKEKDLLLISPLFDVIWLFIDLIVKYTKKTQLQHSWR